MDWIERGFLPIPIPSGSKRPTLKNWPALRITKSDVPQYFPGGPQNTGVLLGERGAADLDLDVAESISAAAILAPDTGLKFGRASKRASHYFYRCASPRPGKRYVDPTDKACVCELRCLKADGGTGLQTVVHGVHVGGEVIQFEPGFDREAANIDFGELARQVSRIAAAALLARHWPAAGHGRHECELALAGCLARAGWNLDDAERFVLATYRAAPDHDPTKLDRVRQSVLSSFEKKNSALPLTGFKTLVLAVGKPVAKTAMAWVGVTADAMEWADMTAAVGRAPAAAQSALAVVADRGAPGPAVQPGVADWRDHLIVTKDGHPRTLLANAITALRGAPEWSGVVGYNEFSMATVSLTKAPWPGVVPGSEWSDHEDRLTANWLQHEGICVSVEIAGQAIQAVARDRCFHPVREYLDSLKWDGTKRIDTWLSLYLGADTDDYVEAVGARWLISAVARIYQPGAKVDCCLILEGVQGSKKSTALKTIAGEWFTDELADLGSKDSALQTMGVWIVEIAELDSMSRGDVGRIKSFMSRSTDRFRPPYGKRLIESPRQCVFAGSVNHNTYLRDETGGRRFWPVATRTIRIDELARDRGQLWAEAAISYHRGASWWLESLSLNRLAEREQSERYEGDSWDELISAWIREPSQRYDGRGHPLEPFTSNANSLTVCDVLTHCIGKLPALWLQSDKTRVARCLRSLGFERHNAREGKEREWRYRRMVPV